MFKNKKINNTNEAVDALWEKLMLKGLIEEADELLDIHTKELENHQIEWMNGFKEAVKSGGKGILSGAIATGVIAIIASKIK